MNTATQNPLFADLVAHGAWARRLAQRLLAEDDAADLAQDALVAAAVRPPPVDVSVRQWLGGVVRNLARLRRRGEGRQRARERAAGALVLAEASRPDELAERLEAQQRLARLVLALAPIYRDVVLLRFYDDLSTEAIARRLALPPGTVRRRLHIAMAELRAGVEAEDRSGKRWVLVVLAGAGWAVTPRAQAAPFLAGAVAAVVVVGGLLGDPGARSPVSVAAVAPVARAAPPALMAAAAEPVAPAPADPIARFAAFERHKVPLGSGPMRGPGDAKVTLIEFVDYQCPFTARAAADVEALLERHGRDLRFQVIHRPMAFHPEAALLARAALAADAQGRFWPMHARLLAHVRESWTPALLARHARELGLDEARFRADLEAPATRARLAIDEATAASVGIEGVPTFFVNGRPLVGRTAPEEIGALVREEIAHAEALLARGTPRGELYNALLAHGKDVPLASMPPRERVAGRAGAPEPGRWQGMFTRAGGCMPPLPAPSGLDFRSRAVVDGRHLSSWGLIAAGDTRYNAAELSERGVSGLSSDAAEPGDFVAKHQTVRADAYRGKRVRFSAQVKAEVNERTEFAGLWIRVEGDEDRVIVSDRARMLPGDRDWRALAVTVDVPADARAISYGLLLAGRGRVSMQKLAVETLER